VSAEDFEGFEDFERWTARDAAVAEISVHATGIDRSAVVDGWRELPGAGTRSCCSRLPSSGRSLAAGRWRCGCST
jgi:hypothetical protein